MPDATMGSQHVVVRVLDGAALDELDDALTWLAARRAKIAAAVKPQPKEVPDAGR